MAVIYEFDTYRTLRPLKSLSQQAREIVRCLYDLTEITNDINANIDSIEKTLSALDAQLETYRFKVEATKEFARKCSSACELNSIDQMIKKRDQIIRDRFNASVTQKSA